MSRRVYQDALEAVIRRLHPEVEGVEFDEDGQHIYLAVGDEARRYRLGEDTQRFLSGEFPPDRFPDELWVTLEAPDPDEP